MRPTSAIVRLNAIVENYKNVCRLTPGSNNVAVIKANAYGHGAVEVARALEDEAPAFAVAFFEEAVQLRDAGITRPVLILQGILGDEKIEDAADLDFWLMLSNRQQIDRILTAKPRRPIKAWLKVETGMHRLGLEPREAESACEVLSRNLEGNAVIAQSGSETCRLTISLRQTAPRIFLSLFGVGLESHLDLRFRGLNMWNNGYSIVRTWFQSATNSSAKTVKVHWRGFFPSTQKSRWTGNACGRLSKNFHSRK